MALVVSLNIPRKNWAMVGIEAGDIAEEGGEGNATMTDQEMGTRNEEVNVAAPQGKPQGGHEGGLRGHTNEEHYEMINQRFNNLSAQRVETVVYYLQEEADHWWVMEGPTLKEKEGFDWKMFKVLLRERFYPEYVEAAKYEEFLHLEQGSMSVQEYHVRFVVLSQFAPTIAPDEASKAWKFVRGLHYDAQKLFTAAKFATLNEAYDAVADHSRIQQLHRIAMHGPKKKSEGNDSQSSKGHRFNPVARNGNRNGERRNPVIGQGVRGGGLSSVRSVACTRCGRDHPRTTCGGRPVTCFNCGKPGHRAAVFWYPKM
ncbi:PREDICTED: uncharacterized protein LOC109192721 [Ipomoea nil]|uniref:uncharacterized protein LOC109192721 n=1 Tax=Ipomoea nil TaxID=35883 RepID=UPI000901ECD5|nr:PREDICTED: uncharacterized protein LOC109192721 [Ipomoea nil]